jgi:DNA-binding NarL/FixJ family response regulator
MDGKRYLHGLLNINPNVKVLVSSGLVEDHLIQAVINLGARGSLTKPFNVRELLNVVRQVLDADQV